MGRRLAISLAVIATVAAMLYPTAASARGAGRYIVVLEDSVSNPRAVAAEHSARFGAEVSHVYRHALKGYAATLSSARLAALRADSRVAFVSQDREVRVAQQTLPTGVNRIEGDLSSTASGNGSGSVNVRVAIIDTGIDLDHPDLNVVGGKNCSKGKSFDDGNGHGTHVAGTVAAKDNADGVVGVAPGAPLYAVRVLNNAGFGSWSAVICGIDWVTANAASTGIKVANMSLGGSGSDDNNCGNTNNDALHKAICRSVAAGVTYVVAAGNSNANLSGFVPAAYNEVLSVTAMADFDGLPGGGAASTCRSDVDETAADFSNFATSTSDSGHTIAAPGVCILSTWKSGGYNTISGTSMASPHAAGAAALCIAGPCGGMSPSQVRQRLRQDAAARPASYGFTGDPNSPSGTRYYGYLLYAGGY
jgi:subtilisin